MTPAKKQKNTHASIDDITGFGEAEVSSQIANRVFEDKFKTLTTRLEKQESISFNIIIGSVLVLFFSLAGFCWGTWIFIGGYNQHYLDVEKSFQKEINDLRKENFEFKEKLLQD